MITVVGRAELGECPAASELYEDGGVRILLNRDVYPKLHPVQQRFILGHELGHLVLETDDEHLADAFALGLITGRFRRSLRHAVAAVASMEVVPAMRLQQLLQLCEEVQRRRL